MQSASLRIARYSRPRMGAWIEIQAVADAVAKGKVAPVWGRGLKLLAYMDQMDFRRRPRMGAWIEIFLQTRLRRAIRSPPYGGVD